MLALGLVLAAVTGLSLVGRRGLIAVGDEVRTLAGSRNASYAIAPPWTTLEAMVKSMTKVA